MQLGPVTVDTVQYFLLVFIRITAMLALMPVFGSQNVPFQLRTGLSFALTIILFPFAGKVDPHSAIPIAMFVFLIIKEISVGLIVGYIASMLFSIVQFAGYLADSQMGFTFVEVVDPFTDMTITTMGQFQILVFTMLFLAFNGHYFMILAIQKSFELIPIMGVNLPQGSLVNVMISVIATIFPLSFKLAAPIFITLILTSVAMAVIARTVPQINIFFVGIPLNIIIGLGMMFVTLPLLALLFKQITQQIVGDIWKVLYLMAGR